MTAAVVASLIALLLAEILLRIAVGRPHALGQLGYADGMGEPIPLEHGYEEAVRRGLIVPVPWPAPRFRTMFAPGQTFYLAYSDQESLRRGWLDDRGRVAVHINAFGLRERDEITTDKPPEQRRVLCLGDSFTFGWGIPAELGWVRLLEEDLRRDLGDVRTVNCGAAGTVCVDEYVVGLEQHFRLLQPDAVIVTICLNDLIPSNGLAVFGPSPATGVRLVDMLLGALGRSPLDLDPRHDWLAELNGLDQATAEAAGLAGHDKPFEAMWKSGVPQRALRDGAAWCRTRGIPFLVVLWPFLQGLGPGRHYPFERLHQMVAADCGDAGIAVHDTLPSLRGTRQEDLWVTPADMHANPLAQRLVMPDLIAFVRKQLGWSSR